MRMQKALSSPESVTSAFIRALNRQDVEAMVALMSPGHRFIDSLGNVVEGREKMRAGWTGYFKMVPDYTLAIEETYVQVPVVILFGLGQGTYTTGKLASGNRWQTPIALRALVEDGLIAEWRVYADNDPIRRLAAKGE
jgi:ketosteroid isomerase-like protein